MGVVAYTDGVSKTERALESEALDRDRVELFDDEAVDDPVAPAPPDANGNGYDAHADTDQAEPVVDDDVDEVDDDLRVDDDLHADVDTDHDVQPDGPELFDDEALDDGVLDAPAVDPDEHDEDDAPVADMLDDEGTQPADDGRRDAADDAGEASDDQPDAVEDESSDASAELERPPVVGDPLVSANGAARTAPLPPPDADASGALHVSEDDVATARADGAEGAPVGFVGPEPSEDVLEELRRADVDGPTVKMAPHDDTTSARRRPRRLPEYDPAPIPVPTKLPRVLGRKPRVRKVTRVVRSVDPWSVFKIAMIASLVLYVIALTSGVLLWNVAYATGTIDNVERFFESFGWTTFEFNGGEIFHAAWIGGLFAALGLTGLAVLGAALFNLITDLVGGVRLTVLEEEVVEARTSPMRRFVVRRSAPEVPAIEDDPSGSIVREAVVDDSGAITRRTR